MNNKDLVFDKHSKVRLSTINCGEIIVQQGHSYIVLRQMQGCTFILQNDL